MFTLNIDDLKELLHLLEGNKNTRICPKCKSLTDNMNNVCYCDFDD